MPSTPRRKYIAAEMSKIVKCRNFVYLQYYCFSLTLCVDQTHQRDQRPKIPPLRHLRLDSCWWWRCSYGRGKLGVQPSLTRTVIYFNRVCVCMCVCICVCVRVCARVAGDWHRTPGSFSHSSINRYHASHDTGLAVGIHGTPVGGRQALGRDRAGSEASLSSYNPYRQTAASYGTHAHTHRSTSPAAPTVHTQAGFSQQSDVRTDT